MPTYRTGNHWGVTIVREDERTPELDDCAFCVASRTGCPIHGAADDQLVAVVVNGDQALAERICELLNADEPYEEPECGCPVVRLKGRTVRHAIQCTEGENARFVVNVPLADSCTCPFLSGADPNCVVHQGRRAKGPKPPPLGPGCICDGSGRACPRHGEVM